MFYLCVLVIVILLFTTEISSTTPSSSLRVISYNVRFDSQPDNITIPETNRRLSERPHREPSTYYPKLGEQPWSTRRIHIANDILAAGAHVYGGQELLQRQVDDLQELLGPLWSWVGVGRDDGKQAGEYSPVFYQNSILRVCDWDTFWLTSTPFDVSKYPDAGSKRICTAVHFTWVTTHDLDVGLHDACNIPDFTVLNTHLDDQSSDQRALGASLILQRAKFEAIKTKRPVILTGDFNSPPIDRAYNIIIGHNRPEHGLNRTFLDRYSWTAEEEIGSEKFRMLDLLYETPPVRRSGNHATFTDFADVDDSTAFERLDYVFAGSNGGWNAMAYRVGSNLHDDGVYASDHRPVHADIKMHRTETSRDIRKELEHIHGQYTLKTGLSRQSVAEL